MSSFAEFDLCNEICQKFDSLGLMTWLNFYNKIAIEFYFDDENIGIDIMPYILNKMVENSPRLLENGWEPNFKMIVLKLEEEIGYAKQLFYKSFKLQKWISTKNSYFSEFIFET